MQITIDTNNISATDRSILEHILGKKTTVQPVEEPKPATSKPARKAPAPKPAPVEEPEVEDEAEDEDLLGGGVTLQDAIDRATELVSEGKAAQVKAALAKVGAKRVSDIKQDSLKAFVDAL